ncbi:MAG: methyltransferase domain-containing protein [Candidatus Cloacimonetes bacterium]|nr:methyltransferase domain-containing protein [Candidatus Cloacimonadota bacterium]
MKETDFIKSHDVYAASYDDQVKEFHSYGHDVLFGMCFEYIKPGETLLDLGIGTGLSSIHFSRMGLDITGLDGSEEMLKMCRKKSFAKELKQYDIRDIPLPYPDRSFSNIICCGVFHFFGDILPIIKDAHRILKPDGLLAFSIAIPSSVELKPGSNPQPDYIKLPTAWGVSIFKHTDQYIKTITDSLNFTVLKEQKILTDSGDPNSEDIPFKVIILRK